ncbi:hypothetical protein NA898_11080 [Proteus cibi]|uniref:IdsE2 n=1 Tax=Proteus cibi TaxID=2050966 RepID=A0ABU6EHU9_9GAMM|nr:hypothetical protein [Proteus cibi]MEB6857575.1 hypothetical protein [Proteus cibi]MEB7089094.1 hypothetical protein [Proteus cibi]
MASLFSGTNNPHKIEMNLFKEDKDIYNENIKLKDFEFLNELTENACEIDSPNRNIIKNMAIPIFIVIFFSFVYLLYDKCERIYYGTIRFEESVKMYEEDYDKEYSVVSNSWKEVYDAYKPYFNQEISYWDYLKAYYSGEFYQGTKNAIYQDIALFSMPLIGMILMGLIIFYMPWVVLKVDRRRQILYVWNSRQLLVTRYRDAEFGYAGTLMFLKLYCLDKKTGKLIEGYFKPNISYSTGLLVSRTDENKHFVTFINTFMKEGRDTISQTNYSRRKSLFGFNKNPLPADFEQQVSCILAEIDKKKVNNA